MHGHCLTHAAGGQITCTCAQHCVCAMAEVAKSNDSAVVCIRNPCKHEQTLNVHPQTLTRRPDPYSR